MRALIAAIILAVGLWLVNAGAAPIGVDVRAGVFEGVVEQVQWGGGRCERLRRACIYKDEKGETGEGNCRRYRAECEGGGYCARLRRACIYKDQSGETGEGNCRRYRRECGGR